MNKKEFVQWLDQFPDDTIIQVVVADTSGYSTTTKMVEFTGEKYEEWDFMDLTGNPFTKPSEAHFNKKFLELGVEA